MDHRRYHLDVRDFGPIIQADVELRPLSVFIGPSNTGKSWMAILIYALHRIFAGNENKLMADTISRLLDWMFGKENNSRDKDIVGREIRNFGELFKEYDKDKRNNVVPTISALFELLKPEIDKKGEQLNLELCRCFGIDANEFIRRGGVSDPVISIRRHAIEGSESYDCKYQFLPCKVSSDPTFTKYSDFKINLDSEHDDLREIVDTLAKVWYEVWDESDFAKENEGKLLTLFKSLAISSIRDELVGPFRKSAYYFPADRTGVLHAHSVVVSSLIESSSTVGLHSGRNFPSLTGVLADFLQSLIQIGSISKTSDLDGIHATELERKVLRGEIGIEPSEVANYPKFTYQPDGWDSCISLNNASSMVSELAPIILYLRHIVLSGSVLLVEEPESHLHPAMQVEFIRQLASLIHSGIHVIVTTHSEFLMEEIGNIVRRSSIDSKSRLKDISDSDVALDPSDVGVWLFRPETSGTQMLGSVVEEVPLDESGLYPSGFDDVSMALHNDWANISSEIGNSD